MCSSFNTEASILSTQFQWPKYNAIGIFVVWSEASRCFLDFVVKIASPFTAARKTVSIFQDFSLEPEFGNTWWSWRCGAALDLGRKSEGENIVVQPSTSIVAQLSFQVGDLLQGAPNGGHMEQIHL